MTSLEMLIKGLLAGLAIAIPVGPVNVMCVSRTLTKGWKSGLVSGLGAGAADTLYGSIAGFSITFVIYFLIRQQFWIRLVGGALLILIGVAYYFKRPQSISKQKNDEADQSDFASTFFLNLTNPTTVLSFLAVLAALGLNQRKAWWQTLFLVGGIFCGSMLWWVVLTGVVNKLRDKFNDTAMLWMNRIAGLAIGGFGLVTMITAHNVRK